MISISNKQFTSFLHFLPSIVFYCWFYFQHQFVETFFSARLWKTKKQTEKSVKKAEEGKQRDLKDFYDFRWFIVYLTIQECLLKSSLFLFFSNNSTASFFITSDASFCRFEKVYMWGTIFGGDFFFVRTWIFVWDKNICWIHKKSLFTNNLISASFLFLPSFFFIFATSQQRFSHDIEYETK